MAYAGEPVLGAAYGVVESAAVLISVIRLGQGEFWQAIPPGAVGVVALTEELYHSQHLARRRNSALMLGMRPTGLTLAYSARF